jgi:hypothetical protein
MPNLLWRFNKCRFLQDSKKQAELELWLGYSWSVFPKVLCSRNLVFSMVMQEVAEPLTQWEVAGSVGGTACGRY